ncbi:AraC family transcriptional regulator [Clostridium sp. 'deep sea']|uniref:AraC family transcriptional regulator n=1 Tax=Clostridium sp. 'deep sea' TaxID=2779445 RepID=UPI00189654DF|nr:AraC family transcriptional regulator [Clostridium sp. 'deep sea']QOR34387.1 AraC family transcriptional regulator [Clostridium sp. 'deep sea']
MDFINKMNDALEYIEHNLTSDIDFKVVAQKACSSSYNFQRMFSFITDVSLADYIRRRRLTLAAFDIVNTKVKIIDIALKYGYESPVSFSRAFQSLHKVTPSKARKDGANLKAYPRLSFQISIKGEKGMDYRIEHKDAFEVYGIEGLVSTTGKGEYLREAAELWQQSHKNGEYERLFNSTVSLPGFVNQDLCKVHAVMNYRKVSENVYPYMICSFVSVNSDSNGFEKVTIPAQTWAIFRSEETPWSKVSEAFSSLNKRFYSEWLPTSTYIKVDGPEFEIYGGNADSAYLELWIPVTKE